MSRLCTNPFTSPLLVETAILRLWHGHLTGPGYGWRPQKTSFCILVGIYCQNIPTHIPQSGYHGVTEVAKPPNIAEMAEKCINCMSARPTSPIQTLWSRDPETLFRLKIEKNQKIHDFRPKKKGGSFFDPPTPQPPPHLPENLKKVGFKWGVWGGSGPKTHWGMRLLDKKMILQGVKLTIQPLGVGYANRPKKAQNGGYVAFSPIYACLALI